MSIKEDREQFALGMAQLADLSKLCSEYVSSFTTPTPSNYEFGGAQIKIAQPKTSVFPTDADSASFGGVTSEYDSNFVSATPMTEVKLTATKKKMDPKLDIGPYKEQKSTGWSSEYDAVRTHGYYHYVKRRKRRQSRPHFRQQKLVMSAMKPHVKRLVASTADPL